MEKQDVINSVNDFKIKNGIDGSDENISVILHLMHSRGLDKDSALDQCARGSKDYGIDGWVLEGDELSIYQSKLTNQKQSAIKGFLDLQRAGAWLEDILIKKETFVSSDNNAIYTLHKALATNYDSIKNITFILLSIFSDNITDDTDEYEDLNKYLYKSRVNEFIKMRGGKISIKTEKYELKSGVKPPRKQYPIKKIEKATIDLRENSTLDLAYIPLHSLVELYRQRGDVLFEKNVRMSLMKTKEAKDRLVNPMEKTLSDICEGKLSPNIFPFYHIGVTICAYKKSVISSELMELESPNIINGAQTLTIANHFLKELEINKKSNEIEKFNQIKVITKIVSGTTNDELKEITNANNRQNPIDNWQLFCNDNIHIEIEHVLKDKGIFYERQKGKFDSLFHKNEMLKIYYNTNNTCIKVEELGQIICLGRLNIQMLAKPSEIFLNKDNHEKVFKEDIPQFYGDIIFLFNIFKALKRGLNNYLNKQSYATDGDAQKIFKKPLVRNYLFYFGMLYFYQSESKKEIRQNEKNYTQLSKIANASIVDETDGIYSKILSKIKSWYISESNNLSEDVSSKKINRYFEEQFIANDLDSKNKPMPFTNRSHFIE